MTKDRLKRIYIKYKLLPNAEMIHKYRRIFKEEFGVSPSLDQLVDYVINKEER